VSAEEKPRRPLDPEHVHVVRAGHGANCSSIGSVIDTLFVTALAGGAIFAAVMAALAKEPIVTVAAPPVVEKKEGAAE
jgi:hypothetical protein